MLLQTVPVPDPGSLVRLKWAGDNDMVRGTSEYGSNQPNRGKRVTATFSCPGYLELRKANKTLTDIAALNPNNRLNIGDQRRGGSGCWRKTTTVRESRWSASSATPSGASGSRS